MRMFRFALVVCIASSLGACSNDEEIARMRAEYTAIATRLDIYRQEKEHLQHYIDLHYDHSGRTSAYVVQMADSMAQLHQALAIREQRIRQLEAERKPAAATNELRQRVREALPDMQQRGISIEETNGKVSILVPKTLLVAEERTDSVKRISTQGLLMAKYLAGFMRNNLDLYYEIENDSSVAASLIASLQQQQVPAKNLRMGNVAIDGTNNALIIRVLPAWGAYYK
jgi:septal ring factor EnvC (AmiA/AmiB activator)